MDDLFLKNQNKNHTKNVISSSLFFIDDYFFNIEIIINIGMEYISSKIEYI